MTDLLGEHDSWSLGQLKMGEDETKWSPELSGSARCTQQPGNEISHIIAYILILV